MNYLPIIVLGIILFVVIPFYFIVKNRWDYLRLYAYMLIRVAERTIECNNDKFDYVLDTLYNKVTPTYLKPIITKARLSKAINAWFSEVKDFLDDGKINKSLP